jgi:hypothetical protein
MKAHLLFLAAAAVAAPAFAQPDAQCIVAGRLSGEQWAPRFAGVQLLGADGRAVTAASKSALAGVKQVRLAQPALLSRCDGDAPLANADAEPAGRKSPTPALSAGLVQVEGVSFPKLRTGGELVELKVRAPAERVVMR